MNAAASVLPALEAPVFSAAQGTGNPYLTYYQRLQHAPWQRKVPVEGEDLVPDTFESSLVIL